jgi:hypothetical protein
VVRLTNLPFLHSILQGYKEAANDFAFLYLLIHLRPIGGIRTNPLLVERDAVPGDVTSLAKEIWEWQHAAPFASSRNRRMRY